MQLSYFSIKHFFIENETFKLHHINYTAICTPLLNVRVSILGLSERTYYPHDVTNQKTVIQATPTVKANTHVYQNTYLSLPHTITAFSTNNFTATYIIMYSKSSLCRG